MPNWRALGPDQYINQANLCMLGFTNTDETHWYIQGTYNGIDWVTDTNTVYATQAAVKQALANYVASLG
jgi:hypothetical protein